MAKKKIEQPAVTKPLALLSEPCGCTVYATAVGTKLERCMAHDSGPDVLLALANILDCQEDDIGDQLETAERMMDELLETHGGRVTAKRHEMDGVGSYSETLSVMKIIPR